MYSRFPSANSFQTITIAMHGAIPIKISPVKYSGEFFMKMYASTNMNKGAMIQVMNKDMPINFKFLNIRGISSYLTFAIGGYIIKINPIAKGMLVVPLDKLSKESAIFVKYPNPTPINMAAKIQSVKKRSKKLNRFLSCAGVQLFLDIFLGISNY
jgi:hypothetical protein